MSQSSSYQIIEGVSSSPGIAIGRAFIYSKEMPAIARRNIAPQHVESEVERFLYTLHQVGEEIRRTRRFVEAEQGADLAQIFEAQLLMVEDVEVKQQTLGYIREQHYSAERAFSVTLQRMKEMFKKVDNDYLRARLGDIIDIEYQVLNKLAGGELEALRSLRANTIVVARDLLPSEAVQLGKRLVKGIVTDGGGPTSHTSIIARSLGLPAVVGSKAGSKEIASGDPLIVDGSQGIVHVRPDHETLKRYRGALRKQRRRERDLLTRRDLPAITRDGIEITLMANIDLPAEVQVAIDNGATGVGMFRTELLFSGYELPGEEEQLATYGEIVEALSPHPVIIRTIDLGGDKLAHVLPVSPEANPFLGWRGIRICLDTPVLFKTQLRALLRASAKGDMRILIPMISGLSEVRQAQQILRQTKEELAAEGLDFKRDVQVGIMVEVPSVAILAETFAAEVDFFSLGTNDLVQYTLAVDRGNARVAALYEPFHPAVLKLIKLVADSGKKCRIPVSICGEMAADPLSTYVLLGLGLDCLSVSPGSIPEVKEVIRSMNLARARELAERCLEMETGAQIRDFVEDTMRSEGCAKGN